MMSLSVAFRPINCIGETIFRESKNRSDLSPTLGHKIAKNLGSWLLSPLLWLSQLLNVFGGNRKPYTGSLESTSDLHVGPPFGPNWGHKIVFSPLSPLLLI